MAERGPTLKTFTDKGEQTKTKQYWDAPDVKTDPDSPLTSTDSAGPDGSEVRVKRS